MFSHACDVLDLAAVLRLVAERCVGETARSRVLRLRPLIDREAIAASLAAIEELRSFRSSEGDIVVADTAYASEIEASVERSPSLAPESLLAITTGERVAAALHRLLSPRGEEFPVLCGRVDGIVPQRDFPDAVENAIDADGSVKDSASPDLRRLRRQMVLVRSSLRRSCEKMLGGYGEDSLATVIGNRHVLVVPRNRVPRGEGIVHSASHTGGSLYFEPPALVGMNNELETHLADEGAEIARILRELTDMVRACAPRLLRNADVLTEFDALRARTIFCCDLGCNTPVLSSDGGVRLEQARHPELSHVLEKSGAEGALVPLDIEIERNGRVLVITGPNAGGKTVALKTVGICVLMLQCGLQVPCEANSELPVFKRLFVDIGDEQSIESSTSTFTSHLRHIDEMNRKADDHSLCLIDEIGDGTDPDEGAALAIATLERLLESGAVVIATTHYGRIKTFALETEGVANASMAFDDDDARPLYRLLQGMAGRSRGIETARRTGFDEGVVRRAEAVVGKETYRLEEVLAGLETERLALERVREEVRRKEAELDGEIASYREKAQAYSLTRRQAERRAFREAEQVLVDARRDIEQAVRSIREEKAERSVVRRSRKHIEESLENVRARLAEVTPDSATLREATVGDRVSLSPTGTSPGTVISVGGGRARVEINNKRITIPVDKLYAASDPETGAGDGISYDVQFDPLTSTSIDVRGRERDEALAAVSRFVDQAVLSGIHEVKIVHGVGERILERAVREYLQGDHRVESTRMGEQAEGGAGVTLVRFK